MNPYAPFSPQPQQSPQAPRPFGQETWPAYDPQPRPQPTWDGRPAFGQDAWAPAAFPAPSTLDGPCPPHPGLASPPAVESFGASVVPAAAALRPPPAALSAGAHAARDDRALGGEVVQKLLQSRLFTASAGLDTKHRRPFMVSFPVGPVSVGIGLDVCRLDACEVALHCRDDARQDEPCLLAYSGQTQRGVLVGFGAKGASVGASLYGGSKRGTEVAFRRAVHDLAERRRLRQACWDKRGPKDDPALAPWFRVPDPKEPEHFGVGDMWEQTAMHQLQGGLIVGSVAQKVDLGLLVAGQFVLRVEKVAADVMRCSVIPVRFKRLHGETGNLAESVALSRDETQGNSVTFQFRLDHPHGRQAYLALIARELPQLLQVSPAHTPAPVALVSRESVNATTVRWQMQLLRSRFALGASREAATHTSLDASGSQSLLRTGKEKTQMSWHGSAKRSWEVFALYNHLADAHGVERRVFREMLLYLNHALQPAEKDLLRRHDGAALAQARQKQLVELARSLNTGLPALSRPQAEGHFAVEVFVLLDGSHINLLANKSAHEVADAAWRSHVDERRAREVAQAFAEMRAIESEQRALERQACHDARAAGHAPSPADNALLRAAFDQAELDATTRQAQVVAKLLEDGEALSLVTYILQQPASGLSPAASPLAISCSVDCSAYEAADDFVRDVPELEEAIAAEPATTADGRSRLRAALARVGEGIPLLRTALQTAAGDALSAAWEGPSWAARRARWQETLGDVRQLGSAEALALRADGGEAILQHEELYAVATSAERVALLRRRWHALQDTQPKALDTVAHLLDDCLEELHAELKVCRDALGSGEEADAITGWVGIGLVALVHAVERDAPISAHPRIRRQLRQMHAFLGAGALAQFGAGPGAIPYRQPLTAPQLALGSA